VKKRETDTETKWPRYLIAGIVIFIIHLIVLIIIASRQDVSLVRTDYYQAELKYQEHLESADRATSKTRQINVLFDSDKQVINLVKSSEFAGRPISGKIHFYRPSDSALDRKQNFTLTNEVVIIDVSEYKRGLWKIKVDWSVDDKSYYTEEVIFLETQE